MEDSRGESPGSNNLNLEINDESRVDPLSPVKPRMKAESTDAVASFLTRRFGSVMH